MELKDRIQKALKLSLPKITLDVSKSFCPENGQIGGSMDIHFVPEGPVKKYTVKKDGVTRGRVERLSGRFYFISSTSERATSSKFLRSVADFIDSLPTNEEPGEDLDDDGDC